MKTQREDGSDAAGSSSGSLQTGPGPGKQTLTGAAAFGAGAPAGAAPVQRQVAGGAIAAPGSAVTGADATATPAVAPGAAMADDIAQVKQAIDAATWDGALKLLDGHAQLHDVVTILSQLAGTGHLAKLAANATGATPRVASAIDTVTNHKVDSAKVAADASDGDKADLAAFADLRRWPELLPHATRDKDHQITVKKGTPATKKGKDVVAAVQNSAVVPDVAKPTIDVKQQQMVNYIAATRDQLPDLLSAKYGNAKGGGGVGYMYGGKDASKPTDVKAAGTDKPSLQKKWVWEEVGSEGGASSVNTYDGMDVTYGKGFAAGGAVESMLQLLFAKDPAVKDMFLDAGVTIDKGKWQVVNTALGAIEDDKNALHLFEVNPKLLSIFVTMAEDPKHAQTNLDVQWEQLGKGAGKIPDYAKDWDELPTKLCVHLKHWLPGYAWVANDYSATAGDTLAIVKRFGHLMVAAEGSTQKSGALLVDGGKTAWGTVSHLKTLAKGAGFTALSGAATLTTITKEQLDTDKANAGKLLFPAGKGEYYVVDG
jgi:hypothetical protein